MKPRLIGKTFYAIIFAGALVFAYISFLRAPPQYKNEAFIIPTIVLFWGNFPMSLFVAAIHHVLSHISTLNVWLSKYDFGIFGWIFTTWLPLGAAGYIQWFIVLPWHLSDWHE